MNIYKYIELLRFYITEKIGQLNQSVNDTLDYQIEDVLSSILSAVLSLYISADLIRVCGLWGTSLRIVTVIILYILLKCMIRRIRRYRKSRKEEKKSDKGTISRNEAKLLVDKFDHIACDGILLSRDYLQRYNETCTEKVNERLFYLFEAVYYYKKALQIVALVIQYPDACYNNPNNINGISMYRFSNVYKSLVELKDTLLDMINIETNIEYDCELKDELSDTIEKLNRIDEFIKNT